MSDLILEVKDLSALCHGERIFNKLNLEWFRQEHLILLGVERYQQGLLELLMGHWPVVSGSVQWKNLTNIRLGTPPRVATVSSKHRFKNLSNLSEFYYQQRYNSQDAENALTARQYLFQSDTLLAAQSTQALVKQFDLQQLLDKPLIQLSNGEMRRVLIAEAVRDKPDILLLDMPFTGLDSHARQSIHKILNELASEGTHLLMTGSLKDVPDCITHIVDVNNNTATKHAKAIYSKPAHENQPTASFNLPLPNNGLENIYYKFIVRMKDVNVRYGQTQVLYNLSWDVQAGERWALIGNNGAGKTTVLSLINGDNPQGYANDIILFDRKRGSGESIWDIKRKTGFVSPELHRYFPAGTSAVYAIESGFHDTIGLFRPSNPSYREICLQWMELFDIAHLSVKRLETISFAEQRLCLLARAMVKRPPLLLLDEPCQGLDDDQVERFKMIVDQICNNSNTTLIYVTHYNTELPNCITKTLKLHKGVVVENSGA